MEIKDFKEMTEKHVEACKIIIEKKGLCVDVACFECPFYPENSLEFENCNQYGVNESFVKSAKKFIELYNNKDIKVDEKRNSINLDMNIFTKEFGKMKVSTDKHLDKVEEEYYELCNAYEDYKRAKDENLHPGDIEDYRKQFCLEALDTVQAAISFVSYLIEECIMTDEDIEAWKIKLEDRKKKYLK